MNSKKSSSNLASQAAKSLSSKGASVTQKSLAASVLSQRNSHKQTGAAMENKATQVLRSIKYSTQTKSFAASVLSQSNKSR